MNASEGFRRLGLVTGVVGFCFVIGFSYYVRSEEEQQADEYREFQELLHSPVVQHAIAPGIIRRGADGSITVPAIAFGSGDIPIHRDGIAAISFKRNKKDEVEVECIERDTGEKVWKSDPVNVTSWPTIFTWSVIGFLVPWGSLKTFAWVVIGFFGTQSKTPESSGRAAQ